MLAASPLAHAADAPIDTLKNKALRPEALSNATDIKSKAEGAPPIELKNKSSFQMESDNRNPFWPIGWKPSAKLSDPGADHAGADIPTTAFVVSSITIERGGKFAIVNGKVMTEGQQFGLQLGNQTYQVTLKSIEDGRVVVARRDQEIVVPLRRK
jgi:hypothetical protein